MSVVRLPIGSVKGRGLKAGRRAETAHVRREQATVRRKSAVLETVSFILCGSFLVVHPMLGDEAIDISQRGTGTREQAIGKVVLDVLLRGRVDRSEERLDGVGMGLLGSSLVPPFHLSKIAIVVGVAERSTTSGKHMLNEGAILQLLVDLGVLELRATVPQDMVAVGEIVTDLVEVNKGRLG